MVSWCNVLMLAVVWMWTSPKGPCVPSSFTRVALLKGGGNHKSEVYWDKIKSFSTCPQRNPGLFLFLSFLAMRWMVLPHIATIMCCHRSQSNRANWSWTDLSMLQFKINPFSSYCRYLLHW
jgi:hypothetical protein